VCCVMVRFTRIRRATVICIDFVERPATCLQSRRPYLLLATYTSSALWPELSGKIWAETGRGLTELMGVDERQVRGWASGAFSRPEPAAR
jgi:hypothetical protein